MASPAYQIILDVQAADIQLMQLRAQHAKHPLRDDLAQAVATTAHIDEQIAAHDDEVHRIDRQMARLGDEVATIDRKLEQNNARMYDGSVTATKELVALQEEAAMLESKKAAVEDQQLELMEQMEMFDATTAELHAQRAAAVKATSEIEGQLTDVLSGLEADVEVANREREAKAGGADPELLAMYDSLRHDYDGAPIAQLVGSSCGGCHMQLSAMLVDRLVNALDETVINCEECGRLLVR